MAALLVASLGLAGLIFYSQSQPQTMGIGSVGGITDSLNSRISNGYQFRDITYVDTIDIGHPDVKNNLFAYAQRLTQDRGTNGIPRAFVQLYPESSEITHLSRTDNLYL
jgi:hypothetical protein